MPLMMKKKEGVIIIGLQKEMIVVLEAVKNVYIKYGQEPVITSGLEGTHTFTSKHPFGYGLDFRTRYFKNKERPLVAGEIAKRLGLRYFVLLERNHLHIHFKI